MSFSRGWLLALLCAFPAGQASAPQRGTVLVRSFFSRALGARKRYLIYLPPSYARSPRTRYPVAYVLHGRTGNEADWVARGELDAVADSVFSSGLPELILVMPDGDNSFWVNWAESPGYERCASDSTLAETAGSFCVPFSRYGDYIARDLVAHVDSGYRTLAQRAHRGLMGLSMGGTGALTLSTTYPEVFSAAAALSAPNPFYLGPHPYQKPAHHAESIADIEQMLGRPLGPFTRARWGADTSGWWRHAPERGVARLRRSGARFPAIRIDVGQDDPYIDDNRALDAALSALDVAHEFYVRPGRHEWAYWRNYAGETLAWLGRQLGR